MAGSTFTEPHKKSAIACADSSLGPVPSQFFAARTFTFGKRLCRETHSRPESFGSRIIAYPSDAEKARPWHCSRYNRKARSAWQQGTSFMAIVLKAAKNWGCNRGLRTEN